MHVRGLSVISAEPILGLVRAHVRRTQLARLGIVYQVTPSPSSRPSVVISATGNALGPPASAFVDAKLHPHPRVDASGEFGAKPQPQALVSLGQALYMDSIIEGGIDGEELPVTLDRGLELNLIAHTPGALLNMQG